MLWMWIGFRLTVVLQRYERWDVIARKYITISFKGSYTFFLLFSLAYGINIREALYPLEARKFKKLFERNSMIWWAQAKTSWSWEAWSRSGLYPSGADWNDNTLPFSSSTGSYEYTAILSEVFLFSRKLPQENNQKCGWDLYIRIVIRVFFLE